MSSKYPPVVAKDVIYVLNKLGYEKVGQSGSHKQYRKNQQGKKVTVPNHGNVNIKNGTFMNILKQIEIEKEEFYNILNG